MSRQTTPVGLVITRDRRRPRRKRPLAGGVEQALLRQPRLQRLESERQVTEARRLDRLDVELQRALRLEQVDPAVGDDPEARLGLERRPHPLVAEPDALERVALVLEGEVRVAGGLDRHPADLALDPDVAQSLVCADRLSDRPRDLADAEDPESEGAGWRARDGWSRTRSVWAVVRLRGVPSGEHAVGSF